MVEHSQTETPGAAEHNRSATGLGQGGQRDVILSFLPGLTQTCHGREITAFFVDFAVNAKRLLVLPEGKQRFLSFSWFYSSFTLPRVDSCIMYTIAGGVYTEESHSCYGIVLIPPELSSKEKIIN